MRAIKILVAIVLGVAILSVVSAGVGIYLVKDYLETDQPQMFEPPVFDTHAPSPELLPVPTEGQLSVLVFSKTNGFRHREAIAAASAMLRAVAAERNWLLYESENGALFDSNIDEHFDVMATPNDAWDIDGYRRLEDAGVTHILTMPWAFYFGDTEDLEEKLEGTRRFAEDVILRMR